MRGLNEGTYHYFREKFADDTSAWRDVILALDVIGGIVVLSLLVSLLVALLLVRRNVRGAVVIVATCTIGTLVVYGLNAAIGEPGPPESDKAYAGVKLGPSFINQTAFLSSLVLGLWAVVVWQWLGLWTRLAAASALAALVLAIGFSQLYLRLTYLTPMLAGWDFGLFCAVLCCAVSPLDARANAKTMAAPPFQSAGTDG